MALYSPRNGHGSRAMTAHKVSFIVDKDMLDVLRPIIKRRGMSFSSWVRVMMAEYLEAEKTRGATLNIDDLGGLR